MTRTTLSGTESDSDDLMDLSNIYMVQAEGHGSLKMSWLKGLTADAKRICAQTPYSSCN